VIERQDRLETLLGGRLTAGWVDAFRDNPRHLFIPDRAERVSDDGSRQWPIDRARDLEEWLDAVYSDDIIITQRDDVGRPSSSSSMPYMVFGMLDHLGVRDGDTVCEIGTGTGWSTALLCSRLGDHNVVTIEIDPHLAEIARANLRTAGREPTVVIGDGAAGWAAEAPYDRVVSTCAVHRVPYAWVDQTVNDGVVLTPWGTPLHNGALLRLVVGDDGTAGGRFVESANFMVMRGQFVRVPDEPDDFPDRAARSDANVDLDEVFTNDALFAIGLLVRDCKIGYDWGDDGTVTTFWLLAADSWASIELATGTIRELGPRSLWGEVESAYGWWVDQGRPGLTRFGVTVYRSGQSVWLDEPGRVIA
jgi:protein-L-isoaspartate(D-aspartate) O-methyltransferase